MHRNVINSGNSNLSKSIKPNQIQIRNANTKTRTKTEKLASGVSNISMSIRSSEKFSNRNSHRKIDCCSVSPPESIDVSKADIGIQVNEVEIIEKNCEDCYEGDVTPTIRLPSDNIIKDIDKERQQKNADQIKERLRETRIFGEHAMKQKVHLNNLNEFLETGTITHKSENFSEKKITSERTRNALEAYNRIKQKEEDLLKMFSSI